MKRLLAACLALLLAVVPALAQTTDVSAGLSNSVAYKLAVRVATTGNITLYGLQTIDTVALAAGDRVLVKDQSNAAENGIYVASTGAWSRAPDFANSRAIARGTRVSVVDGGNSGKTFVLTTPSPAIGSALTFLLSGESILGSVNPRIFGAQGVDTDDTAAIQRAFNSACAAGRSVMFDAGVYFVSSTISVPNCQNLEITTNAPPDRVIIHRTGSFGDTFAIGSLTTPALSVRISGLWFLHGPIGVAAYTPGQTSLDNKTSDGGAHIHVVGGQNVYITGNNFWRGQYAVKLSGGSIFHFSDNRYFLVWDHENAGAQEGIADVLGEVDGNGVNPKDLFEQSDTHLGALSASRVATLPDSSTHTMQEFVGPQHSVLLRGMETAHFDGNYFGDANVSNLCLCTQTGGLVANVSIASTNFFDGARGSQIQIVPDAGATIPYGIGISGVFNGEFRTNHHILIPNIGTSPAAYDVTINGCTMAATYGSGMVLTGLVGGTIGMCTITSYNAFNLSTTDAQYVAAVYADAYSKHLNIGPLTVGGGSNDYTQTTGAGDYAYQGVTVLDTNTTGVISSSLVHDILDAGIVSP